MSAQTTQTVNSELGGRPAHVLSAIEERVHCFFFCFFSSTYMSMNHETTGQGSNGKIGSYAKCP